MPSARPAKDPVVDDSEGTDEELGEYEYTNLTAANTIRVLTLRPGSRKKVNEIVCELVERNLDEVKGEYEALSWAWGTDPWDERIRIRTERADTFFKVPKSLASALRALRDRKKPRNIWIDAICINQKQFDEKNKQVPMMSKIYGGAKEVCIWLGDGDEDSRIAFEFIDKEVLKLQKFDALCDDESSSRKWNAMLNVMKRPWFSRRWVVQEIALANDGTIYCGKDTIPWNDFADAVQLFVEVETATHRLSEVMKKDPQFYHVPGWFEYVSALGASLLVDATGTLFRISKDEERTPLLSLEYLVSALSVFEVSNPRDSIYSLLAISKDTTPVAVTRGSSPSSGDPAKDATSVPVTRSPSQAPVDSAKDTTLVPVNHGLAQSSANPAKQNLSARALRGMNAWASSNMKKKPYKVDYEGEFIDICKEFIIFSIHESDKTRALDIICRPWAPSSKEGKKTIQNEKATRDRRDGPVKQKHTQIMPSWIPKLTGAAYAMYTHPNSELKMGRKNADPLVGLPSLSQRNYSAAETRETNLSTLKFKPRENYYSMYVSGFILDEVAKVEVASQSGNIPEEWIAMGGWDDTANDPPPEFWRTLVADRGRHGRNPPTYYARACKESITKGLTSGSLNTTELINDGRCSVISEFFRRVQAVIWNRSLMRTKAGRLGIVRKDVHPNDLVCILYGCSVPVILREHIKENFEEEQKVDDQEHLETTIQMQRLWRERRKERLARDKDKKVAAKVDGEALVKRRTRTIERATRPGEGGEPSTLANEIAESKSSDTEPANIAGSSEPKKDPKHYYYEFIGECYVHGMMDGEAIKYQNDNAIKVLHFELR